MGEFFNILDNQQLFHQQKVPEISSQVYEFHSNL